MRTLLFLFPLLAFAEEAERTCTLKLAWWDAPATIPGPTLALASDGAEPKPFSPQVMNFTTTARNRGDVANLVVKEISKDPKAGKDAITWNPFASINLPKEDDTLGVILLTDAAGKKGSGRAFALGANNFPMGSVRLFNLTNRQLLLGMDNRTIAVSPGNTGTHPKVFQKAEISEITVVANIEGETRPVFTTKSEFSNLFRLILFVVEVQNSDPVRFEVRTIIDFPQPETKVQPSKPATDTKSLR
jgi:hypothetical protein